MISMGLKMMKFAVVSVVVLVISQIHVKNRRICDHVRDVVQHAHIQRPVTWIAQRFNFLEGNTTRAGLQPETRRETGSEVSESDRGRLSGLLKRRPAKR